MSPRLTASEEVVECGARDLDAGLRSSRRSEIIAELDRASGYIVWQCPVCGDQGKIRGWEDTLWNRHGARPRLSDAPPSATLTRRSSRATMTTSHVLAFPRGPRVGQQSADVSKTSPKRRQSVPRLLRVACTQRDMEYRLTEVIDVVVGLDLDELVSLATRLTALGWHPDARWEPQ